MKKKRKYNPKFLAYLEVILSIGLNSVLFVLQHWAGIVSGSVALIADSWHTLSDSMSSLIVLISIKISSKPADEEHPFGHGRAELISSLILSVFLFVISFKFIFESFDKLQSHKEANFGALAIIVTIIVIITKESLARYAFWAGKKTGSQTLKADGWHHRSDVISSIIILTGIFLGKYYWWIDGVLGFIVAGFISFAGYTILKDAANSILGESPEPKLIEKLKKIANDIAKFDVNLHHVHIHKYGDHTELTFHITLPDDMTLIEAHDIATEIENSIKSKLGMESTIHTEPKYKCTTF